MSLEVFFEPLPKEPEMRWLNVPRSYSMPTESVELRPKLQPPLSYADKRPGVVAVNPSGTFSAPIRLFKAEPGIYTLVCWVKLSENAKGFPATAVCVRAE